MSGGLGFSRRQRLLKAAEYEAVFAHRCAVRTHYFQIMGKPNELGFARLGMVVSKRVFSRAVDRNFVRRKIREAFRHSAAGLPAMDVVVRPMQAPDAASDKAGLGQDLLHAFGKVADKCFPAS